MARAPAITMSGESICNGVIAPCDNDGAMVDCMLFVDPGVETGIV